MRRRTVVGMVFVALLAGSAAAQGVPDTVAFTGRLAMDGAPVTGNHSLTFKLFDAPAGGIKVWEEPPISLALDNGLIYRELGTIVALDSAVFDGRQLFLEVTVDSTVMQPRLPIASVPYAIRAGTASSADLLGGLDSSDVALATHDHAGTYLPVGTTLACTGTDKVTGIGTDGSVACAADSGLTAEADGVVGNEVSGVTNTTLSLSGSGTPASPYTLGLNLARANTWTGSQTFSAATQFPGSTTVTSTGAIGIKDSAPNGELEIRFPDGAGGTGATISTDWGFQFQMVETGWTTRPWLKSGWTGASGDYLYIGSVGNQTNANQHAIMLTENEGIWFGKGSDATWPLSANLARLLQNGDMRIGGIGVNTGGCLTDGDNTIIAGSCVSDVRFKKNIVALPPVLDRLARLRPVTFDWRGGRFGEHELGTAHDMGLIAQQVEPIFPELVETDDDGYKRVDYVKFPILLIQAVKELKEREARSAAEVVVLRAQLDATDARLAVLERRAARPEDSVFGVKRVGQWMGLVGLGLLVVHLLRRRRGK